MEWPPLPMASFRQELTVMLAAEAAGVIDGETITKTMFGVKRCEVARRSAAAAAEDAALRLVYKDPKWASGGSEVAARLLAAALEEGIRELDMREAFELDGGSLQQA